MTPKEVLERVTKPSASLLSLGHVACGQEFCCSLLVYVKSSSHAAVR